MKKLLLMLLLYAGAVQAQTFDFGCVKTLGNQKGKSITTPCGEVLEWQTSEELGLVLATGGWGNNDYQVYESTLPDGTIWVKNVNGESTTVNGSNLEDDTLISDVFADWVCVSEGTLMELYGQNITLPCGSILIWIESGGQGRWQSSDGNRILLTSDNGSNWLYYTNFANGQSQELSGSVNISTVNNDFCN